MSSGKRPSSTNRRCQDSSSLFTTMPTTAPSFMRLEPRLAYEYDDLALPCTTTRASERRSSCCPSSKNLTHSKKRSSCLQLTTPRIDHAILRRHSDSEAVAVSWMVNRDEDTSYQELINHNIKNLLGNENHDNPEDSQPACQSECPSLRRVGSKNCVRQTPAGHQTFTHSETWGEEEAISEPSIIYPRIQLSSPLSTPDDPTFSRRSRSSDARRWTGWRRSNCLVRALKRGTSSHCNSRWGHAHRPAHRQYLDEDDQQDFEGPPMPQERLFTVFQEKAVQRTEKHKTARSSNSPWWCRVYNNTLNHSTENKDPKLKTKRKETTRVKPTIAYNARRKKRRPKNTVSSACVSPEERSCQNNETDLIPSQTLPWFLAFVRRLWFSDTMASPMNSRNALPSESDLLNWRVSWMSVAVPPSEDANKPLNQKASLRRFKLVGFLWLLLSSIQFCSILPLLSYSPRRSLFSNLFTFVSTGEEAPELQAHGHQFLITVSIQLVVRCGTGLCGLCCLYKGPNAVGWTETFIQAASLAAMSSDLVAIGVAVHTLVKDGYFLGLRIPNACSTSAIGDSTQTVLECKTTLLTHLPTVPRLFHAAKATPAADESPMDPFLVAFQLFMSFNRDVLDATIARVILNTWFWALVVNFVLPVGANLNFLIHLQFSTFLFLVAVLFVFVPNHLGFKQGIFPLDPQVGIILGNVIGLWVLHCMNCMREIDMRKLFLESRAVPKVPLKSSNNKETEDRAVTRHVTYQRLSSSLSTTADGAKILCLRLGNHSPTATSKSDCSSPVHPVYPIQKLITLARENENIAKTIIPGSSNERAPNGKSSDSPYPDLVTQLQHNTRRMLKIMTRGDGLYTLRNKDIDASNQDFAEFFGDVPMKDRSGSLPLTHVRKVTSLSRTDRHGERLRWTLLRHSSSGVSGACPVSPRARGRLPSGIPFRKARGSYDSPGMYRGDHHSARSLIRIGSCPENFDQPSSLPGKASHYRSLDHSPAGVVARRCARTATWTKSVAAATASLTRRTLPQALSFNQAVLEGAESSSLQRQRQLDIAGSSVLQLTPRRPRTDSSWKRTSQASVPDPVNEGTQEQEQEEQKQEHEEANDTEPVFSLTIQQTDPSLCPSPRYRDAIAPCPDRVGVVPCPSLRHRESLIPCPSPRQRESLVPSSPRYREDDGQQPAASASGPLLSYRCGEPRVSTYDSVVKNVLSGQVGVEWNFDILGFSDTTDNVFTEVGYVLLHEYCCPLQGSPLDANGSDSNPPSDRAKTLNTSKETLLNFLYHTQNLYQNTPYHNQLHGAMVGHTMAILCNRLKLLDESDCREKASIILAALCHDVGHPGRTNLFFINTYDQLAIIYNDQSVLENFHAYNVFKTLNREDCDIFENLTEAEFRLSRKQIIELILATDMKQHFEAVTRLKIRTGCPDFSVSNPEDRAFVIRMCIKFADLSHSAIHWDQHFEWSCRIAEEFYDQGDEELRLNMPFSPLCDRSKHIELPKSQVGFLNFVIKPLTVELVNLDTTKSFNILLELLEQNTKKWSELAAEVDNTGSPIAWPPRLQATVAELARRKQSLKKDYMADEELYYNTPINRFEQSYQQLNGSFSPRFLRATDIVTRERKVSASLDRSSYSYEHRVLLDDTFDAMSNPEETIALCIAEENRKPEFQIQVNHHFGKALPSQTVGDQRVNNPTASQSRNNLSTRLRLRFKKSFDGNLPYDPSKQELALPVEDKVGEIAASPIVKSCTCERDQCYCLLRNRVEPLQSFCTPRKQWMGAQRSLSRRSIGLVPRLALNSEFLDQSAEGIRDIIDSVPFASHSAAVSPKKENHLTRQFQLSDTKPESDVLTSSMSCVSFMRSTSPDAHPLQNGLSSTGVASSYHRPINVHSTFSSLGSRHVPGTSTSSNESSCDRSPPPSFQLSESDQSCHQSPSHQKSSNPARSLDCPPGTPKSDRSARRVIQALASQLQPTMPQLEDSQSVNRPWVATPSTTPRMIAPIINRHLSQHPDDPSPNRPWITTAPTTTTTEVVRRLWNTMQFYQRRLY